MNRILLDTINKKNTSRPPVWFMRQAGRILPSYRELKKRHHFYSMMKDKELAAEVTLLPINDLKVDAAILFSDILLLPHFLGQKVTFEKKLGPVLKEIVINDKFLNAKFITL